MIIERELCLCYVMMSNINLPFSHSEKILDLHVAGRVEGVEECGEEAAGPVGGLYCHVGAESVEAEGGGGGGEEISIGDGAEGAGDGG